MNIILRIIAALAMAAVLSFAGFGEAAETNCYEYFTQEDLYTDSQSEVWYINIDPWVIENPTDGVLMAFGGCLCSLIAAIESTGKTGYVVILNDGWIPARSNTIDRQLAQAMADMDELDDEYIFDIEMAYQ